MSGYHKADACDNQIMPKIEDEHQGISLVPNPKQCTKVLGASDARGGSANPRNWSSNVKFVVGVVVTPLLIFGIVLGAVYGSKTKRYPPYSKLNYSVRDTYEGTDFFENFDYFTGYDPTQGFVHYVDRPGSELLNLTYATSSHAVLRVDISEKNASTGRKSARISSKNQYDNGLFIFDIGHFPYGCGTWSALWLTDVSHWPDNGEIDIVESVNQGTAGSQMTLHTSSDCTMEKVKRKQRGTPLATSCANSAEDNAGCGVSGPEHTYGEAANNDGGGVYAMELRSDGIRTWFFGRSSIPPDVSAGISPDPETWGYALADFPGTECEISTHFKNQSILVNIDLCGTWAGAVSVYSGQDKCPGLCSDHVATNATAFENAFWSFNSVKVYQAIDA